MVHTKEEKWRLKDGCPATRGVDMDMIRSSKKAKVKSEFAFYLLLERWT